MNFQHQNLIFANYNVNKKAFFLETTNFMKNTDFTVSNIGRLHKHDN